MTRIFLIAGEASGDTLGASLMQEMRVVSDRPFEFAGIGGPLMTGEGLQSLFSMTELSIMGLAEVVKHLPLLKRRLDETVAAILRFDADVLVTIDAPDFCLRVARRLRKLRPSLKIVHYVAPTVWAWRPGRAKKIALFLDGIMCLFPFEPPYFQKHGLRAEFVGHSLTRIIPPVTGHEKAEFCAAHGELDATKPILCLLPGSRQREVDSLLPLMRETVDGLSATHPEMQYILPTLPHLHDQVVAGLPAYVNVFLPETALDKYKAFAAATLAVHASGTVALELALCATPMVTIYKVSAMTAFIARLLLKTKFANLVNILLRLPAVPELLQEQATVGKTTRALNHLLENPVAYDLQKAQLAQVAEHLDENLPFSAARFVLSFTQDPAVSPSA